MNGDASGQRESGRHPVSIGHLVMGVALLGLVGVWALWQGGAVASDDVHWLMPVPWVLAGAVGLVAAAVTGSRRHATRQTGWVEPPVSDPYATGEPQQTPSNVQNEQSEQTEEQP